MNDFPVDAVVLWVDGGDEKWLAEKNLYAPKKEDSSNAVNRFRDWGLMKYWFRSMEKYAPWFRTVHFVTWGHLPPFLNRDNPRLHIVNHRDYMPEGALPTFSSHALEMNVHRIPGLSDRFVYFNDDTFLLRPMAKKDFFDPVSGLPCAHYLEIPHRFVGKVDLPQIIAANDMAVVNKHFAKKAAPVKKYFGLRCSRAYPKIDNIRSLVLRLILPEYYTGFKVFHAPAAFLKSTFEEMWEKEPELLARTTAHKFRQIDDVNQWAAQWWQLAGDKFSPHRTDNAVEDVFSSEIDRICDEITGQSHDMICVNDPSGDVDFETLAARLQKAFDAILPEKCSFEQ